MKILVLGAAGMIGRKLADRLVTLGTLDGRPIQSMVLADVITPKPPVVAGIAGAGIKIDVRAGDLADEGVAEGLVAGRPDLIFHLAAVVSGEAEADFDKGYRVNLDGTRALFEAIRRAGGGYRPKLIYASSVAVYGPPLPERIGDAFLLAPMTSYGTQKAICELLLSDYSRRGFFDGIGLRLPTICIRPGKPNRAASGFFSNILREPLAGKAAVLPVPDTVRHWFASPRSAINFLIHAAALDTARLGSRRNLNLPGISATVADEIAALGRVAGEQATRLIRREPDPAIQAIVETWAQDVDDSRARALGFEGDASLDDIIAAHLQDEPDARGSD